MLRREGADTVRRGRPWSLPLEDRVLLGAAYWRINLTLRQLAPLFGVSKSSADRIINHLGPLLALRPRKRWCGGRRREHHDDRRRRLPGTGLLVPHRRERGQDELPAWQEEHNAFHRKIRARIEHAFARMKSWKILRDCRLKDDGVHHAMCGIARLHNLALAG